MRKEVSIIKNRLEEVRKEVGISQAELAKMADVSRNTIVKIEGDSDVSITTGTMSKIAKALGVKAEEIFLI